MDFQNMLNQMQENDSKERANYHLTYGELIDKLKSAPKDAKVDKRFEGIGSYRGSYIEIAIFTKDKGLTVFNDEVPMIRGFDVAKWYKDNVTFIENLPTNANELGKILESMLGKYFQGWKGGEFKIERWKPIWLCEELQDADDVAIVGIDDNLEFITKQI